MHASTAKVRAVDIANTTGACVPSECNTTSPRTGSHPRPNCAPRSVRSCTTPAATPCTWPKKAGTSASLASVPTSGAAIRPSSGITTVAPMPSTQQTTASRVIGTHTVRSAGRGAAAACERGRPSRAVAVTIAKQVTARPAVSASAAPATANTMRVGIDATSTTRSSDCSNSHSLTNPFSGGSAAIATAPTMNKAPSTGKRRSSPPMRSRSWVPVAASRPPAPRNSNAL